MADRYWVGTSDSNRSGTWSTSTTVWSVDGVTRGASAPTSADTVYFPDHGVAYTVTLSGTINCNSFYNDNWNGTTFAGTGTLNVYGNTFSYGSAVSFWPGTGAINFVATTATAGGVPTTVYSNGVIMYGQPNVNSAQVGVILGDYWTVNTTFRLTAGLLDLNYYGMACYTFQSDGSTARSISFASNTWIELVHPSTSAGMLLMATLTNFTVVTPDNDWTSEYLGGFRGYCPTARTFNCGNTATTTGRLPNLKVTGGGVPNITSPAYFDQLDLEEISTTTSLGTRTWNCRRILFSYNSIYTGITLVMTNPNNRGVADGWLGSGWIYTNGVTIASLQITCGSANEVLLWGGTFIVTGSLTHNSGTLQLLWDVTLGNQYSSSNSNVRKLIFNYAGIYFSTTTSGITLVSMATATNYSFEGYGDTLGGSYGGAFMINTNVARTITIGSSAAPISSPDVYWFDGNASSALTVTSGSWFNVFRIGYSGDDFLGGDGAYPGGALTSNITLNIQRALLLHTVGGTGLTINTKVADGVSGILALKGKTIASITVNNVGTGMIKAAQTGTVTSAVTLNTGGFGVTNGGNLTTPSFTSPSNTSVRALDFSDDGIITLTGTANNIVLNMPRPTNCTVTGGINSGFVSNMNVAKTFNYGATSFANNEFLPSAPGLKLTGSSTASITDKSSFGYLNLGELNSSLFVASGNGAVRVTSLRLNSVWFGQFTAKMYGDGTISSTAPNAIITAIEMAGEFGYATALANSINCSTFTMNSGRLDLEGFNLRAPTFNSTVSTASDRVINGPGRIYDVDTITIANGTNWYPHASYADAPTLEYRGTTLNGNGASFGILDNVLGNEMTITGSNYFADLKASVLPATFKFTSGTTTTFGNITASGTATNKITLRSTVPGSQATFTRVGWSYYEPAPVEPSYLILQDINATGTAQWPDVEWRAYNGTITNGGNNTGWLFLRPSTVNGQFLVFFEGIS